MNYTKKSNVLDEIETYIERCSLQIREKKSLKSLVSLL